MRTGGASALPNGQDVAVCLVRARRASIRAADARDQDSGLRLAELVAAFSKATHLGMGQPIEHVLRS